MASKIDDALTDMISMKPSELDAMDSESMTMAEQAARKIIVDAIENGGAEMKLLVERLGGTSASRNQTGDVKASRLADALKAVLDDGE